MNKKWKWMMSFLFVAAICLFGIISREQVQAEEKDFTYLVINEAQKTCAINGYVGVQVGDLIIPSKINGYKVVSIAARAFENCHGFTGNIVIPEGVRDIGYNAFLNCTGASGELVLPNSVVNIGSQAFARCSGLTGSLKIPENVAIGDLAFSGCSGFTGDLVIPKGVTIGGLAFRECNGFTGNLIISKGVTMGEYAFYDCNGFTGDLIIPDDITEIKDGVFFGCSGFSGNLIIPDGVTKIGDSAFFGCSGFTGDLVIPNSITQDGDTFISIRIFENCKKIARVINNSNCWFYLESLNDEGKWVAGSEQMEFVPDDTWYDEETGEKITGIVKGVAVKAAKELKDCKLVYDEENGIFQYCENGEWIHDKYGYVSFQNERFLVANGMVASNMNGLAMDPENSSDWYYVAEGRIVKEYSGLTDYDGAWFYVVEGKLDTTFAGYVDYDGGKFYVGAGRIMKEVNGLAKDPYSNEWYYLANGQAQTQYTGLAMYDEAWFYVVAGKLAEDYTGYVNYDGSTFYVVNGMVK